MCFMYREGIANLQNRQISLQLFAIILQHANCQKRQLPTILRIIHSVSIEYTHVMYFRLTVDGWHLQEPQNRCTALEPGEEATEGMTLVGSLIYIGTDPTSPHHLSPLFNVNSSSNNATCIHYIYLW